jgi:Rieske Fe-S protein
MDDPQTSPREDMPPSRRRFFELASVAIQGALGAAVVVPALGALAFPLWGETTSRAEGFLPVGSASVFPPGKPVKVVIRGTARDAWTRIKGVSLGSAWVVRREAGAFDVYSSTCPHLGCAVNFEPGAHRFLCPCHGSHFDLSGSRIEKPGESNPAPRGMDPLEYRVEAGELLVRYVRFRTGTEERTPV